MIWLCNRTSIALGPPLYNLRSMQHYDSKATTWYAGLCVLHVLQVAAQLFGPPVFNPRKLTTTFLPGATPAGPLDPRRYTLTHNDLTGQLALSIGAMYNTVQVSGWYTRLIRRAACSLI